MNRFAFGGPSVALRLGPFALLALVACSAERASDPGGGEQQPANATAPGHTVARPALPSAVDDSRSVVQRGPRLDVSLAESSLVLRSIPRRETVAEEEVEHEVKRLRPLRSRPLPFDVDPVLQNELTLFSMPVATLNFLSQGNTNDPMTMTGTPPDTNGAVGPNHFVQLVNGGLAIWDKSGHVVQASRLFNVVWTGYVGTHAGNGCAADNDGDPVVVYDQMADRWFLSQFSLPNGGGGPNFQCVAVSKTADPTGAYWLYDFQYDGFNDYGKFGVWPDAYYATFNMFNTAGGDSDFCAYDRVSMLAGSPATQQCFQQGNNVSGALPVSMDGKVTPPRGEPGFFMQLSDNMSLDLFKFHVDWTTPANSAVAGPTNIAVVAFSPLCANTGNCVPQPAPGNPLDSLSDRMMFRLTYRNFGTHEALMVNHSVDAGGAGGVRWYEIRSPNGTPTVFQQGTYAPADGKWRWMASLAQDQAEGFVLGFSVSSATEFPSIGWTGRLAGDPPGVMGQGESVVDTGTGVETGNFSDGSLATRWGDYSNITVDPSDDCTFWYTQELYHVTGPKPRTWDTEVATVKFPSCAANDFSLTLAPASRDVPPGGQTTYTATTMATVGTPETIVLNVQDLPSGVTGAFMPASVMAGATSTLTLTAAASAPLTQAPVMFTIIGKAPSAVHPATAHVSVALCKPTACPPPDNCGTIMDSCGHTLQCGTCTTPKTCGGGGVPNQCGCTPKTCAAQAAQCGSIPDQCGGMVACGACPANETCTSNNKCVASAFDGGADTGAQGDGAPNGDAGNGGASSSSGCGCRTVPTSAAPRWAVAGVGLLALLGARRRTRRRHG